MICSASSMPSPWQKVHSASAETLCTNASLVGAKGYMSTLSRRYKTQATRACGLYSTNYELPTDFKLDELYCFASHGASIFPFKRVWVVVSIGLSPALQKKRSSLRRSLLTLSSIGTHHLNQDLPLPPLVGEGVVIDIDLNDISLKAGYQSLPLDTAIKITELHTNHVATTIMIDCKKSRWRDENLSRNFQDYFDIASNLLLTASDHNYQDDLENEGNEIFKAHLEDFIRKYLSLELQLRNRHPRIDPKMTRYCLLQFAASIFTAAPVIVPLNSELIVGKDTGMTATLRLVGSVVPGAIRKCGAWLCRREREALNVQKELVGIMLMSIASRKNELNRILHLVVGILLFVI